MKYRLALVEYLNTLPFSEGLKLRPLENKLEIFKVTPAQCARLFEHGKVDISLCPVGALNDMPSYEICGNYCIGADGEVGSVMLLSQVPLDEIKSVRYDDHSRTSNILLQILAQRFWKKDWDFYFNPNEALPESCLMIGDKVFENRNKFPYQYDLAAAWKEMTGLPMVFAIWIAKPGISPELILELDEACEAGIQWMRSADNGLETWQSDYLLHRISYPLDAAKKQAMQLYFEWAETTEAVPVFK